MSVARVPLTRFFPTPRDSFSNLQQYRREAPYVLPQVAFGFQNAETSPTWQFTVFDPAIPL